MSVLALDPILSRREEIQHAASRSLRKRQLRSKVTLGVCIGCAVASIVPLGALLGYTIERGAQAWSVAFFSHVPTPAGVPGGGIWNAIVGSLIIDAIATAGSIPLGVGIALFLSQSESRVAHGIGFLTDVVAGIPSIIMGIFAYIILVTTLGHFSAIAGSFAVGLIMLPIIIRASVSALRGVPKDLHEAALSLGGKNAAIARRVTLPTALPGLITGVLLAVARGAGESAPLLFTAIGSQFFATSLFGPMASMPLTVYQDGIQAYPDLQRIAWGTGLLLIVLVLILSVSARFASARLLQRRT